MVLADVTPEFERHGRGTLMVRLLPLRCREFHLVADALQLTVDRDEPMLEVDSVGGQTEHFTDAQTGRGRARSRREPSGGAVFQIAATSARVGYPSGPTRSPLSERRRCYAPDGRVTADTSGRVCGPHHREE